MAFLLSIHNWAGVGTLVGLPSLCFVILFVSEEEEAIFSFLVRTLGRFAAPSPEEEADYEYR